MYTFLGIIPSYTYKYWIIIMKAKDFMLLQEWIAENYNIYIYGHKHIDI